MRSQRSKEAAAEDTALYVHSAAFVFPLYLDTYVSTFLEYTFVSVRSAPLYLVGCLIQDSSRAASSMALEAATWPRLSDHE